MARNTPSSVLYKDLKNFGIANKDAARIIFDISRKVGGGKTVGDELSSRPKLSNKYVNVEPGGFDESFFRSFSQSTRDLAAKLLNGKGMDLPTLEAHYLTGAAGEMAQALAGQGIEATPYENALIRIENGSYPKPEGKFELALMLFIICGSLGDPKRAVALEEEFAEDWLGASLRTVTAEPGNPKPESDESSRDNQPQLGIIRINADGTFPNNAVLRALPQTKEGATIGSGACDITDVGPHVSRRHARIYFESGRWYLIGMKSTNGTVIISGADGSEEVVEPPKSKRKRGYAPQAHELGAADIICLADDTRFIVRLVTKN